MTMPCLAHRTRPPWTLVATGGPFGTLGDCIVMRLSTPWFVFLGLSCTLFKLLDRGGTLFFMYSV